MNKQTIIAIAEKIKDNKAPILFRSWSSKEWITYPEYETVDSMIKLANMSDSEFKLGEE